jgi:hypothetical protein
MTDIKETTDHAIEELDDFVAPVDPWFIRKAIGILIIIWKG